MSETTRSRRRVRRMIIAIVILVAIWMSGDFIHSRFVAHQLAQWESTIQRDDQGIQTDCHAYAVGTGDTALLMIHGMNDSPRGYRKMAPALAEMGFYCRVMRLPGFGEPIHRFAYSTRRDWIDAVKQEVTTLRESHQRLGIVAHSLGAAVTISYLLDHPDTVDAIVLIAPAIEVSNQRSPVFSTRTWHELSRWTLMFTDFTQSPFPNDARDPDEQTHPDGKVFNPRRVFDESFALMDHNRNRAKELTCPLMMVLSKNDEVVDWRAAKEFFDEAGAATKELVYAPEAGHAILVDYGWQDVTREIARFVRLTAAEGSVDEQASRASETAGATPGEP